MKVRAEHEAIDARRFGHWRTPALRFRRGIACRLLAVETEGEIRMDREDGSGC